MLHRAVIVRVMGITVLVIPAVYWLATAKMNGGVEAERRNELSAASTSLGEARLQELPTSARSTGLTIDDIALPQPLVKTGATPGQEWSRPVDGRNVDPRAYSTAEELLSEYWGPDWVQVREELEMAGLELDSYPLEKLPRWQDLQGKLIEHIDGQIAQLRTDAATDAAAWSTQELAIRTAAQAAGIVLERGNSLQLSAETWSKVQDITSQIDNIANNVCSAIHQSLIESLSGPGGISTVHPIGFPRKTLGSAPKNGNDYAWMQTIAMDGWAIEFGVNTSQLPSFSSWKLELEELYKERSALIVSCL